jgi:hypothetical protein
MIAQIYNSLNELFSSFNRFSLNQLCLFLFISGLTDYSKFLPASSLSAYFSTASFISAAFLSHLLHGLCLFPFCPFLFPFSLSPFLSLSVSAPFWIDGNCRLCRISLCFRNPGCRQFLPFCMIDIVVPSALHERSSGRDL